MKVNCFTFDWSTINTQGIRIIVYLLGNQRKHITNLKAAFCGRTLIVQDSEWAYGINRNLNGVSIHLCLCVVYFCSYLAIGKCLELYHVKIYSIPLVHTCLLVCCSYLRLWQYAAHWYDIGSTPLIHWQIETVNIEEISSVEDRIICWYIVILPWGTKENSKKLQIYLNISLKTLG